MSQYTGKADDDQIVRATLGRLLFSGEETKKSVKVLSGGEKGRMIYGKLMLTKPNVLLMDEPTNHMDMETIESLQIGLEKYPGTLIFVSHDREFVGGLATRIIELRAGGGITDFRGTYDEYLKGQGIEELTVATMAFVVAGHFTLGNTDTCPCPRSVRHPCWPINCSGSGSSDRRRVSRSSARQRNALGKRSDRRYHAAGGRGRHQSPISR